MTKLLINEPPLQVLPSLAKKIGLNEAILIQQLHYWIGNKNVGKVVDDIKWVRNTVKEWQKSNFPFWSERTILRIITKLEKDGFIISRNDINKIGYDRTKWYTINYDFLNEPDDKSGKSIVTTCHNGNCQPVTMETDTLSVTIPETTTKTTTEKKDYLASISEFKTGNEAKAEPSDFEKHFGYRDEFLKIYNQQTGDVINVPAKKQTIVELAVEDKANPETWERAIVETVGNWSGHSTIPPLNRIIEVYRQGGDYERWKNKTYGENGNGSEKVVIK